MRNGCEMSNPWQPKPEERKPPSESDLVLWERMFNFCRSALFWHYLLSLQPQNLRLYHQHHQQRVNCFLDSSWRRGLYHLVFNFGPTFALLLKYLIVLQMFVCLFVCFFQWFLLEYQSCAWVWLNRGSGTPVQATPPRMREILYCPVLYSRRFSLASSNLLFPVETSGFPRHNCASLWESFSHFSKF